MSKNYKLFALILLFGLLFLLSYEILDQRNSEVQNLPYSKFLDLVEKKDGLTLNSDKDKPLVIKESVITGYYFDDASSSEVQFKTFIPYPDFNLIAFLRENNIQYFQGESLDDGFFLRHVLPIIPYLLIFGVIFFFMFRQLQSTGNRALNFGKSRAKLIVDDKKPTLFKDVAGAEEAKEELIEIVEFLKEPERFQRLGAKIPKGVLLMGPPGTGKTLLAKAVAGEAKVPFFSISGSDFVEMFVGVGASRVRDLFVQAKKNLPCIIFVDEIDAVGRLRGAGLGGGHDEREQTLNQLLVEMDGFEENKGLIMIAATNRSDVLDPALLRPGRFDRQVMVDPPDLNGREEILKIHSREIPVSKKLELRIVAKGTPGFTGADLANVVNEAALLAARRNKKVVEQADFEEARDKVLMGPERKSCFISAEEKEIIAYHESGHALLGVLLEHGEPVHRVTIIPRGSALGVTQQLPDEERHMRTKNYWLDSVCILMGGRIAESLKFKDVTTGASNDIERATVIIRKMITEWGMSTTLGPIRYAGDERSQVFIGRDYHRSAKPSEAYAELVDKEIHKLILVCYKRAEQVIQKHKNLLEKIAKLLLDKETVERKELYALFPEALLKPKLKKASSSSLPSSSKTKKTTPKKRVKMKTAEV